MTDTSHQKRPKVALVLAGGVGSRMGRPKQFIDLLGFPALSYTLRAFQSSPDIRRIYTVGDVVKIEELVREHGIHKYAGCAGPGESRSHSTGKGLALLGREDPECAVLIHDGCRCLVTPDLIGRVARAMDEGHDAAIAATLVSDTIKVVRSSDRDVVSHTLDRSELRAVQTPQAFRLGLLREIFSYSEEFLATATDDASLVEKSGGEVRIVPGDSTNVKLTSPEDLVLAEAILSARGDRVTGRRRMRA